MPRPESIRRSVNDRDKLSPVLTTYFFNVGPEELSGIARDPNDAGAALAETSHAPQHGRTYEREPCLHLHREPHLGSRLDEHPWQADIAAERNLRAGSDRIIDTLPKQASRLWAVSREDAERVLCGHLLIGRPSDVRHRSVR